MDADDLRGHLDQLRVLSREDFAAKVLLHELRELKMQLGNDHMLVQLTQFQKVGKAVQNVKDSMKVLLDIHSLRSKSTKS